MSYFIRHDCEYINTDHIVKIFLEEMELPDEPNYRVHIFMI